jgi:hypothetical protein
MNKECFTFNTASQLNWDNISKNSKWGLETGLQRTNYKKCYYLFKKLLSAYVENTLNGEKRTKAGNCPT